MKFISRQKAVPQSMKYLSQMLIIVCTIFNCSNKGKISTIIHIIHTKLIYKFSPYLIQLYSKQDEGRNDCSDWLCCVLTGDNDNKESSLSAGDASQYAIISFTSRDVHSLTVMIIFALA